MSVSPKAPAVATGRWSLATFLLVAMWYSTSMLAITTSKMAMQSLKVPLTLCSAQFLTATMVAGAVMAAQRMPFEVGGWGAAAMLGRVSAAYTLGFFFTNLAFSMASASFVETVKSGEPISTVVLALALLGERESAVTYASLLPVVVGVAMASAGEAAGGLGAFASTLASNLGFSARAVYAKQLKQKFNSIPSSSSDVCLFFHISWMGLVVLLPLAVHQETASWRDALSTESFSIATFVSVVGLNGLMYTAYNQFSFMVLSRVDTASHAVLNVCRRVCVIAATTVFFGTPLSRANVAGIVVAVMGMCCFTRTKSRPSSAKVKV